MKHPLAPVAAVDGQLDLSLDLVRDLIDHTGDGKTNTIELFDALLTYSPEHARNGSAFIEVEKRFRNRCYNVKISPAVMKKGGKPCLILPSRRENLVEKALRKIAADDANALSVKLTDKGETEVWVLFTIHQLRTILEEQGHGYKTAELTEALSVLTGAKMTISGETQDEIGGIEGSGIIDKLVWRKKKVGDEDGRSFHVSAKFHPLVTRSLVQRTFRRIDFAKLMRPKNELARWLYSRMSHNYIQADITDLAQFQMGEKNHGYSLTLGTIIRETGMKFSDNKLAVRAVRVALRILREHDITRGRTWSGDDFPGYLEEITFTRTRGRPGLQDVLWRIFPSDAVIQDIIDANKAHKAMNVKLASHRRATF